MNILTFILFAALLVPLGRTVETAIKDADGLTSWVYTPTSRPDPTKTYWLVVGVHGATGNGKGACGVAGWATTMDDVVVLGPSFLTPNRAEIEKQGSPAAEAAFLRDTFLMCGSIHEAKLKAQIAELRRSWRLQPKIMLHGFSGGAQFSHRFAFKNPDLVVAVSAHSAGSWAQIEGDDRINPEARSIRFATSCGEADTAKRYITSLPRIEGFRTFSAQLLMLGFNVQVSSWPGVGHTQTDEVKAMALALLERVRKTSLPKEPQKSSERIVK